MPYFSIIIPTLNESKYLPHLLHDLRNQTFNDFEIIIVDGGSRDRTYKISEGFREYFDYFSTAKVNKKNVAYQRNFGAKKAKSEWLVFLDADDRLPNDFFEEIKPRVDSLRSSNTVTTGVFLDFSSLGNFILSVYINFGLFLYPKIGYPWLIGALIIIKKRDFFDINGFREDFVPKEDTQFAIDAREAGYKYKIFFRPCYKFSFRRTNKLGFFRTIGLYLWLEYSYRSKEYIDADEKYPMGGSY